MTLQKILEIYRILSSGGDAAAFTVRQLRSYHKAVDDLRAESSRLAKRANVRLKALEDEGLTASPAYQRATWWTGEERSRMRFSESKKLTPEQAIEQIDELNAFLSASSTVSEERARQSGLEKLMPDGNKKEQRAMMRFLESDAFAQMKKVIGTDIVKQAADAIEAGAKVSDLNRIYKEFLRQEQRGNMEMDILDVWERWVNE